MAEHDPALVEKAADGALAARWPDGVLVDHVSRKTAPMIGQSVLDAVVPAIREAALLEAARHFEYEMSRTWGGDAHWLSTGNRVADVVAECLREMAVQQREEPTDGR